MSYFRFMDMSSGGLEKTAYSYIYIQAETEQEASKIFEDRLGCNPYNITCDCCGQDFTIREDSTLEEATKFDRWWNSFGEDEEGLLKYLSQKNVCVISKNSVDK